MADDASLGPAAYFELQRIDRLQGRISELESLRTFEPLQDGIRELQRRIEAEPPTEYAELERRIDDFKAEIVTGGLLGTALSGRSRFWALPRVVNRTVELFYAPRARVEVDSNELANAVVSSGVDKDAATAVLHTIAEKMQTQVELLEALRAAAAVQELTAAELSTLRKEGSDQDRYMGSSHVGTRGRNGGAGCR